MSMAMSGRSANKAQSQWHHDIGDICGCICCLLDGHPRDFTEPAHVSIHHCAGRTKSYSHDFVLPLCAGHHQRGYGPLSTMLAVHGNKARFIEAYGREIELLETCAQLVEVAGREIPPGVHGLLAKWAQHKQTLEAQPC